MAKEFIKKFGLSYSKCDRMTKRQWDTIIKLRKKDKKTWKEIQLYIQKEYKIDITILNLQSHYNNRISGKVLKSNGWSESEDKFLENLLDNKEEYSVILEKLNKKFGTNRKLGSLKYRLRAMGFIQHKNNTLISIKEIHRKTNRSLEWIHKYIEEQNISPITEFNFEKYPVSIVEDINKIQKEYIRIPEFEKYMNCMVIGPNTYKTLIKNDKINLYTIANIKYLKKSELDEIKKFIKEYIEMGKLAELIFYSKDFIRQALKSNINIKSLFFLDNKWVNKLDFMQYLKDNKSKDIHRDTFQKIASFSYFKS